MTNVQSINNTEIKAQIAVIAQMTQDGASFSDIERKVATTWAGDVFRFIRQAVMLEITGQRLGIAACGIKAVAKKIFDLNQPPVATETVTTETPEEVETPKAKTVKKAKAPKVEAVETTGVLAEQPTDVESPKSSKAIKSFDKTIIGDGVKVAYRADLTEKMAEIQTPQAFEKFFAQLPETCGIVSRTAPYFTRDWTFRIISADEKIKLSMNDIIAKFDVIINDVKDETLTEGLRLAKTIDEVESYTYLDNCKVTNGKKVVPIGDNLKYGVELLCHMTSRTRLKTLATDFAIVELV